MEVALHSSGTAVGETELKRLAQVTTRCLRHREMLPRLWAKERLGSSDILRLIAEARDTGDPDEAIWRAFLAAHFGRESADTHSERQVESAGRFLCAFSDSPIWTWLRVSQNRGELRRWLGENATSLRQLSFGNHRKYESKRPEQLWEVIDSFLMLVGQYGNEPSKLFVTITSHTPQERHTELFARLRGIKRFGRTACFDLLSLVADLKLVDVAPASCYLEGSTGPLEGAGRLWGRDKSSRELCRLADDLANRLNVSPLVLEDALCIWQKG